MWLNFCHSTMTISMMPVEKQRDYRTQVLPLYQAFAAAIDCHGSCSLSRNMTWKPLAKPLRSSKSVSNILVCLGEM